MSERPENPITEEAGESAADPAPPRPASRGPRRGGTFDRDLTQGSIVRNLWALALPGMTERGFNMLALTMDMIWVGRLGSRPLAALGVAQNLLRLAQAGRMGLSTGTRALVSRFYGADDIAMVNHVTLQAFIMTVGFAAIVAALGLFFAETMLMLLGLEPDVVAQGTPYLQIVFVGTFFLSFHMMVNAVLQASGDTVTPMWISVFVRVFHIVIDPFLIFGWAGFPRLELVGAALANVMSRVLATVLGLFVLFSGYSRVKVTLGGFWVDFGVLWRIIRIGIPAAINGMERSIAATVLIAIIATFGTYPVAAYAVARRIEMVGVGLGWGGMAMAAAVIVGQNLGAGQPERAERTTWVALGFLWLILAVAGVLFLLKAEAVVCLFNNEPELVELGSTWLRISVAGFAFMGLYWLISQVLSMGAGDAISPMIVSLVGEWAIEIPLALFLPGITGLGFYAVAMAVVIDFAARSTVITGWFLTGRWKKKRV